MELHSNQAALIIDTSEDGEISVDIHTPDQGGLAAAICEAIGQKLLLDEQFQQTIFDMIYGEDDES